MRSPIMLLLLAFNAIPIGACAQAQLPVVTQLSVQTLSEVRELECDTPSLPSRKTVIPNPDPMERPSAQMLESEMEDAPPAEALSAAIAPQLPVITPGDGYRVAIWGDSHLAAGSFTQELVKLLKLPAGLESGALLPATMAAPGYGCRCVARACRPNGAMNRCILEAKVPQHRGRGWSTWSVIRPDRRCHGTSGVHPPSPGMRGCASSISKPQHRSCSAFVSMAG